MSNGDLYSSGYVGLDQLAGLYDEEFVTAAYGAILGRQPDSGGFRNYLNQIRAGVDKMHIVLEMTLSPEGRGRNAAPAGIDEVIKRLAHRRPTIWNRLLGRSENRQLLELERQMRMIDNHLYLVERALTRRFEAFYGEVSGAQQPLVAAQLPVEVPVVVANPSPRRRYGMRLSPTLSRTFAEMSDAIAARR